jgi:hypothetical protein
MSLKKFIVTTDTEYAGTKCEYKIEAESVDDFSCDAESQAYDNFLDFGCDTDVFDELGVDQDDCTQEEYESVEQSFVDYYSWSYHEYNPDEDGDWDDYEDL